MSAKTIEALFISLLLLIPATISRAQDGADESYSPYSVFGIGDISRQGTAYNKGMGGVGIANRSHRFVNYLNPAAVTARDTLSFMMDVGVVNQNKIFRQGSGKSVNNSTNMFNFVATFPIYKKSAFILGITPFSDVGYDFSHPITDPSVIGNTGNVTYSSEGSGSLYQLFGGMGASLWSNFSVGAELIYVFGNLDKDTRMSFDDNTYRSIYSGYTLQLNAVTGKFGVQYEKPLSNGLTLTAGATYRMGAKLKGYAKGYQYAAVSGVVDTTYNAKRNFTDTLSRSGNNVKLGSEYGIGISLRKDDLWSLEFDYLFSDWGNSGFDSHRGFSNRGAANFTTTSSQSFRGGFEITPNRNDIRYYLRRCTYRIGAYYDTMYYKVNGEQIRQFGLTLGTTLPVFRWYNGLTLGIDLGQKGSTSGRLIKENYIMFNVGINIHDIWFQKPKYE